MNVTSEAVVDTGMDGTPPPAPPDYTIVTVVCLLVVVTTVLPNIIIILLVIFDRKLRKLSNYYIINLAIADCIVGCLVMPCMASYSMLGYWALGRIVCVLWISVDFMCCTASMLSLCMISLDRYWAMTQPLRHLRRQSRKRARYVVVGIWVVSAICWVPAVVTFRLTGEGFDVYTCVYLTNPFYVLTSSLVIYMVPICVMVVLYVNIYVAVTKQFRSIENFATSLPVVDDVNVSWSAKGAAGCISTEPPPTKPTVTPHVYDNQGFSGTTKFTLPSTGGEAVGTISSTISLELKSIEVNVIMDSMTEPRFATASLSGDGDRTAPRPVPSTKVTSAETMKNLRLRKIRLKHAELHRRTARTLGIIMAMFLICWIPFVILFPVSAFCNCVPEQLYDAAYWLTYVNSTVNPFLYGFSGDFREAFVRLFCKKSTDVREVSSYVDEVSDKK